MSYQTPTLRVLQISHDYLGPFRRVCGQYATGFKDHHVTTVYLCGAPDETVTRATGGDEVIFFGQDAKSLRGLKVGTLLRLARLFREHDYDVVIAHRYKPIYLAGILSFFFPIKLLLGVIHEHGVLRRIYRRLFINFWRRNIVLAGVSESVSRDIERFCGPLASANRLYTLPNGLDRGLESSLAEPKAARARLRIPMDAFCFGTVGRLVDKKDHEILLAGFAQVRARLDVSVRLVLIGGGPREASLKSLALQLGIADQVIFTGHVDDAYRYLRALDMFVLSSGEREAFGIVLLEAMMARLPIVCSSAPGPVEVVGETAVLFEAGNETDLGEKLLQAYQSHQTAGASAGDAGHERFLSTYTLEAMSDRLWRVPRLAALVSPR